MIDFPASPTVGQQFTAAGVTWTWDGTKWAASGLSVAYLPLAGGMMTGPIVLAADPTANLQAATKQYVDGGRLGDNRIINGDMRIDQRNNGSSGTATGYTIDRWVYNASQASKGTWIRGVGGTGAIGSLGFPYYFNFASSSAYAALATDNFGFSQAIEADMVSDLAMGLSNAQPCTVSFWANSSLAGTFSGSLCSAGSPFRSYPFTFSLPAASTWTKIAVTIPGDTVAGQWQRGGNGVGLYLRFDLGCGANFRSAAGSWQDGNFLGVTGTVSVVGTNGATFNVTGVKLEIGSTATPFNRQSPARSLADCQRYCQALGGHMLVAGYAPAGSTLWTPMLLPVIMRAAPTVTFSGISYGNASGLALNAANISQMTNSVVITTAGTGYAAGLALLSAEL